MHFDECFPIFRLHILVFTCNLCFMRTLICGRIIVLNTILDFVCRPNCCYFSTKLHVFIVVHDHSRGYMTNSYRFVLSRQIMTPLNSILADVFCLTTTYCWLLVGTQNNNISQYSLILRLFSVSHVYITCSGTSI